MEISTLTWEKVTITYTKPVGIGKHGKTKDDFERAYVSYDRDSKTLSIKNKNDKCCLLAKAVLVSMSPWRMEWTAYWWAGKFGENKFDKLVKAVVVCEF